MFCAFHPNRATVPSFPLLFVWPEIVRPEKKEVRAPADAERRLGSGIGSLIRQDRAIRNHLHETGAEGRRRNPEDHVPVGHLASEVRLRQVAFTGVFAVVDGKERMHTTVRTAVPIADESRFTHRTIQREERRDLVGAANLRRECDLRILSGTGPADGRLTVTARAAIEIHARPEPIWHILLFFEVIEPHVEVREFIRCETGERIASTCGTAPHTRIDGDTAGRRRDLHLHH